MAAVPNQFLLYDTAVTEWINNNFKGCVPAKSFTLMTGTPDRAFAEYITVTGTTPRDGKPPLPRMALTIEDPELEPERFNPNVIRKLGYADPNTEYEIRRANYPTPVRLPYTINFWTEYYREMDLFKQQILQLFRFQYLTIRVDIDSVSPVKIYGEKDIELYIDGALINTGDVEPGNKERILRRTLQVHLKAWLWDFNIAKAYSVKEFEFQYFDSNRDPAQLLEVSSTPQRETLDLSPDGSDTSFGPVNTLRTPIVEATLLVDATVGGSNIRGRDDGDGNIFDPVSGGVMGSVDYFTGEISLTYVNPPDNGTEITAAFFTSRLSLTPNI